MAKTIILFLITMLLSLPAKGGLVGAYTACAACCATVHSYDWIGLWFGAGTTGGCLWEACVNPIHVCIDPRNVLCMMTFLATMPLPTP